ncbi:MAG: MCE family protein [Deltaproteobacteria bacterium]|nr:MAG: MCE family protein [Deltaproteobacteria bacterium]
MTEDLKPTRFERRAGAFLLATVLLTLALGWMAARGDLPFTRRARFHVVVPDAQGLSPGAPVKLKGIVVGRVDEITLSDDDQVDVSFYVDGDVRDRIREGTRVRIDTPPAIGTFLGTAALALDLGPQGNQVLEDEATLPADPPLTLAGLLSEFGDDPAANDVRRLLSGLADLVQVLADEEKGIRTLIVESAALMATVRNPSHTIGRMMTDEGDLYVRAIRLLGDLETAVGRTGPLARKASHLMDEVEGTLDRAEGAVGKAEGTFGRTDDVMRTAKTAMVNLDRSVQSFSKATAELRKLIGEMKGVMRELDVTVRAAQKVLLIRRHVRKARNEEPAP